METAAVAPAWVLPGAVEQVDGEWRLVGVACASCGARFFPATTVCSSCLSSELGRVHLAAKGTVHSLTIVRMAPPGFEAPYGLAWVDLPDGVRVFGPLDDPDTVKVGDAVEVTAGPVRKDAEGNRVFGHRFRRAAP